jgi:hypothetical protein
MDPQGSMWERVLEMTGQLNVLQGCRTNSNELGDMANSSVGTQEQLQLPDPHVY